MNLSGSVTPQSRDSRSPLIVRLSMFEKAKKVTDIQTCGAFSLVRFYHVAYLYQSQYTTQKAGEIVFTHMVACHSDEGSFEDFVCLL